VALGGLGAAGIAGIGGMAAVQHPLAARQQALQQQEIIYIELLFA
jgi:hypothetical protein